MKKLITFLFFIIIFQDVFGQITIDLATVKPGEKFSQTVDPMTVNVITLENILIKPDALYSINIEEKKIPIPPLSFEDRTKVDKNRENGKPCGLENDFNSIKTELTKENRESNIPKLKDKLLKLIKKADPSICKNIIEDANILIANTTKSCILDIPVKLKKWEMLTITIKRDTLTWTYTYKTHTESPWSVMYGFTYVPNWLSPSKNYFTKLDSDKKYTITELNVQSNSGKIFKNITPTIMFTCKPIEKYSWKEDCWKSFFSNNIYQLGLTGGLSLDLNNPTAMVSPSLIFADNLSLNFGLVFTQKDVLNGKYKEGEQLSEILSFEQLHEKKYMPELFFSIAFRFEKNIFKKDASAENKKE